MKKKPKERAMARRKSTPWREVFKKEIEKYSEGGLMLRGSRHKAEMTQNDLAEALEISQHHFKWSDMNLLELSINMKDPISAKLLVEYGADVNANHKNGSALTSVLCLQRPHNNDLWKDLSILMIEKGADVNYNNQNYSPLMETIYIAQYGDTNLLNLILRKGANVNQVQKINGRDHTTPLITAVKTGNLSLVKMLVEFGADVNKSICYCGVEHSTPLNQFS